MPRAVRAIPNLPYRHPDGSSNTFLPPYKRSYSKKYSIPRIPWTATQKALTSYSNASSALEYPAQDKQSLKPSFNQQQSNQYYYSVEGLLPNSRFKAHVQDSREVDTRCFFHLVKLKLRNQPDAYHELYAIFEEIHRFETIDFSLAHQRVSSLLRDHPDLMNAFNAFVLPAWRIRYDKQVSGLSRSSPYKIRQHQNPSEFFPQAQAVELQDPVSRQDVEVVLTYLNQAKYEYGSQPEVFNEFINIRRDFYKGSTTEIPERLSKLFRNHPELFDGFNTFLHDGDRIDRDEKVSPDSSTLLKQSNHPSLTIFSIVEFEHPANNTETAFAEKPKTAPTHPKVADDSISTLKGRVGSSLQLISSANNKMVNDYLKNSPNSLSTNLQQSGQHQNSSEELLDKSLAYKIKVLEEISCENLEDAYLYIEKVKYELRNHPEVLDGFYEIMIQCFQEGTELSEFLQQVADLFIGRPDLIEDIHEFILPGEREYGYEQEHTNYPDPAAIPEQAYHANSHIASLISAVECKKPPAYSEIPFCTNKDLSNWVDEYQYSFGDGLLPNSQVQVGNLHRRISEYD